MRCARGGTFAFTMMIRVSLLLICFNFLASTSFLAQTAPHSPGEFLVSLPEGLDATGLIQDMGLSASAEKISKLLNIWLLRTDLPEQQALSWLLRRPEVRSAQFNHLLENRTIPDDPHFPKQWHLFNDGSSGGVFDADLDAEQAWEITTGGLTPAGDTIVIAVIDGGLQNTHPDLAPNLWYNWAEIPNNGLDDDDNGYVDDFRGWNIFSESDYIEGNTTAHGTPVSAILGARGNNGLGVTGVNWTTKIMFVAASGTEAEILAAFDYVLQARQHYNASWGGKGAFVVAVNCSWGINYGQPAEAPLWCEAFDQLGAAGIVSVAATANLAINVDETGDLPTACPSNFLISVTSLNKSDQKAATAAWGEEHVDLGAYGQDIFTASAGSGYGTFSGTSFAAPQVAGAIGLLYSAPCPSLIALAKINPASAAYWAKSLILDNVTPNPSLDGKTRTDGRLNLYRSLQGYQNQCSSCPAPFAFKTELLTDTSVLLLWARPPSAISVNLRWRLLGMGLWNTFFEVPDSFFLSNLAICTSYEFEMQSSCEGFISAWSQPFIFETQGCCTTPASIWVESSTDEWAKIGWIGTSYNNTYRLRFRKELNVAWTYVEIQGATWVFENLSPCTAYEVQVQARCEDWFTGFSSGFSFKTKGCGACNEIEYCPVNGQLSTQEWIKSVQIGAWIHDSGAGGNGYQNFGVDQPVLPQLASQQALPVVVSPGFSGGVTKEYFRIFVDFNQDGDFEDAGELAFDPGFALEGDAEGLLQVPALSMPGITRMRVMMKYTSPNDNPPTACTSFEFGQVEDYCAELLVDSVSSSIPVADTVWTLRIYPQPAQDWVWLEFPESVSINDCELVVLDLTGQIVTQQRTVIRRNSKVYLNTSLWPTGIYAVQARCGGRAMRGKLIKF